MKKPLWLTVVLAFACVPYSFAALVSNYVCSTDKGCYWSSANTLYGCYCPGSDGKDHVTALCNEVVNGLGQGCTVTAIKAGGKGKRGNILTTAGGNSVNVAASVAEPQARRNSAIAKTTGAIMQKHSSTLVPISNISKSMTSSSAALAGNARIIKHEEDVLKSLNRKSAGYASLLNEYNKNMAVYNNPSTKGQLNPAATKAFDDIASALGL